MSTLAEARQKRLEKHQTTRPYRRYRPNTYIRLRPKDQPVPVSEPRRPIREVIIRGERFLVMWDGSR